jgi:hypothetical protein
VFVGFPAAIMHGGLAPVNRHSAENDHGSMNLSSNTAPLLSSRRRRVAATHGGAARFKRPLHVGNHLTGIWPHTSAG